MDETTEDRVRGALFGHAIGDALGLGAESMSRAEVLRHYPDGLRDYAQIVQDQHRAAWTRGEWTDDTEQMLCILDSLLERRRVVPLDIARRIHDWAFERGRGIGRTTARVLCDPHYLQDPQGAALRLWEGSGRRSASNGAVMRTSVLGLWHRSSVQQLCHDAAEVCMLTHADPRCVASCVAVSLAVARMVSGAPLADAVQAAAFGGDAVWPGFGRFIDQAVSQPLAALDLAACDPRGQLLPGIGYTLKTAGVAFWAVANARSLSDGLRRVVSEGGDADTNAAVAGALLGARDGFSSIPPRWVRGLRGATQLQDRADRLVSISRAHDAALQA